MTDNQKCRKCGGELTDLYGSLGTIWEATDIICGQCNYREYERLLREGDQITWTEDTETDNGTSTASSAMAKRRKHQVGAREQQIRNAIHFNRCEHDRYSKQLGEAIAAGDQDHVGWLQGILSDLQGKLAQIKAGQFDA